MKDLLERAIHQLDKLDDKLDSVDKTLVKQEENLREHMRRTEILESQHADLSSHMDEELEPIKTHVAQVKGVTKFIATAIPILIGLAGVIYKYLL